MPNEIDKLIAEISEEKENKPYKPAKGEEAIFSRDEGVGSFLATLLPFYKQFTGQAPWKSPETFMEGLSWGVGSLTPAGIGEKAGGSLLARALRKLNPKDIESMFIGEPLKKGGSATSQALTKIERPAGQFTHRPSEDIIDVSPIASSVRRSRRTQIGTSEPKQIPQYAGPTGPGGIQLPRISRSTVDRVQDVIDDLFGAHLKAKGLVD